MTECARALKSALTPFHVPLIIDDHADVMLAANADGLHVGQQDLTPADARQLILDFAMVTFMDSSGIGLVMGRFRLMQENEGTVLLRNLPTPIRKVMKLAGLDKLAEFI